MPTLNAVHLNLSRSGKVEADTRTVRPLNVGGGRGKAFFTIRMNGIHHYSSPYLSRGWDDDYEILPELRKDDVSEMPPKPRIRVANLQIGSSRRGWNSIC